MTDAVFRRVNAGDYPAIAALQNENLAANLPPEQKRDGYLSVPWTAEQIAEADDDLAVIVAEDGGALAGYMVGTQPAYNQRIPLIAHMMSLFDGFDFNGRNLSACKPFIYGPACVAAHYRGKGVLEGMFNALLREAADRFDTGVCFIGADNGRSIRAHTAKLGMVRCGDFSFNEKDFQLFAFSVTKNP